METENSSWMIPGKPAIEFIDNEVGKTLVIADLHLGFVYGQNKKGILIPVSKSAEEDLVELVEKRKPNRLIILGDFKDEIFGSAHPLAGRAWKLLRRLLNVTRVTIVKGNHDGKIEEIVYNLHDEYCTDTQTSSMARTTGYTATAAANMFLDGLFAEKGVFPPELLGKHKVCFDYILGYLKERNIHYVKSSRLL